LGVISDTRDGDAKITDMQLSPAADYLQNIFRKMVNIQRRALART
jgi:hypothetical protein